jgi:hypothetical protein
MLNLTNKGNGISADAASKAIETVVGRKNRKRRRFVAFFF